VVLPDLVLNRLLEHFGDHPLPQPLIFEINNTLTGTISHCGVLEFTSEIRAAYIPDWMMDSLTLDNGAEASFTLRSLPKLTFVKFKPLEYAFTEIEDPRVALEMALSKFTALTLGDTITIEYHGKKYRLYVSAVAPDKRTPPAGCVVDTNVEVDFDTPAEEAPPSSAPTTLELDKEFTGFVNADEFQYFMVKIAEASKAVKISLVSSKGFPDLYISSSSPSVRF
jgi:ubiquitin fusion degradation protein 1